MNESRVTESGEPAYRGLTLPPAGNLAGLRAGAGIAPDAEQACLCGLELLESMRYSKDPKAEIALIREGLGLIRQALPEGGPAAAADSKKDRAFAAYDRYFGVSRTQGHEVEGLVSALLGVYLRWLSDLEKGHDLAPSEVALMKQGFRTMAAELKALIESEA